MNCRMDRCEWPKGTVCPWPGEYCPKRQAIEAMDKKMEEISQILQSPCESCRSQCAKLPTQHITQCGTYKHWVSTALAWLRNLYGRGNSELAEGSN